VITSDEILNAESKGSEPLIFKPLKNQTEANVAYSGGSTRAPVTKEPSGVTA
jgi:hypothetical protein